MVNENKKIRLLIVDDSFFMRKLLRDVFNSDSEIEVVGEAKDGEEAVAESFRLKPDVITMDYQMPKMNGAQAIEKILNSPGHLPAIIILSAYAKEEMENTFSILRTGAVDFIGKPSGEISLDINKIGEEIIAKIKIAAQANVKKQPISKTENSDPKSPKETIIKAVVIGASTGGPPVLEDIITSIPASFPAVVLVVQHMPEHFTKTFSERLNKVSQLPVKEAEEGDIVSAGQVFIAPGDFHMKVEKKDINGFSENIIHLTKEPPEHGLRPTINVLMSSVAHIYGEQALGIVLTGMGDDGLEGMRAIKMNCGYTIVQDPETAVIDSMPKVVIKAGLVDEILPPQMITERIIELSG